MLFQVKITNERVIGAIIQYQVIAKTINDATKIATKEAEEKYPEEMPLYVSEARLISTDNPLS